MLFIPDSDMLFPHSQGNCIPQNHLTVTFANQAEPSSLRTKDGNSISGCQRNVFYSISSQIRTIFEPVQWPCTMNVRNEPVHVMACVVKRETPSVWRWKLCEFQHGKRISESGIINIGCRGLMIFLMKILISSMKISDFLYEKSQRFSP